MGSGWNGDLDTPQLGMLAVDRKKMQRRPLRVGSQKMDIQNCHASNRTGIHWPSPRRTSCMRIRLVLALFTGCFATASSLPAQEISALGVERDGQRDRAWRLIYENDFFAATDRYYTQGIYLERLHPALARTPLRHVLLSLPSVRSRFGVAFGDEGYTGSDLKESAIVAGDHPWAGTKQLHAFSISQDTVRHLRLSSQLTIGLIGQGAGGREIQTFIHERTGNTIPQGWHNQIRNDVILNYAVHAEQRLLAPVQSVELWGTGTARAGTFKSSVALGGTLLIGKLGRFFAYAAPAVDLVGYDATLQGGVFNKRSPYTISNADMHRVVVRQRAGVVFRGDRFSVEYFRTHVGAEFAGGSAHRTGGIALELRQAKP